MEVSHVWELSCDQLVLMAMLVSFQGLHPEQDQDGM